MDYTLGVAAIKGKKEILEPQDAVRLLEPFRSLPREVVVVIHLTPDLIARNLQKAAIGSSQACTFDTKDIFREAIIREASAVILAHNHPWQRKIKPTDEDTALTRDMFRVGNAARMPLLDHIILGRHDWYSFKEHGLVFQRGTSYENLSFSEEKKNGKTKVLRMIAKISTGFVIR